MTLKVAGAYLATSGATTVYVYNYPGDAAHTSAKLPFTIQDAPNPVPTVTSLSSSAVTAGSLGFYLHVYGTGFVSGATVNFNHTARATQFNSSGDVQTRIDTSELATGALYTVTVTNPVPGGGESTTSQTFTVGNPVPTLNSLSVYSDPAGSGDLVLTSGLGGSFPEGIVIGTVSAVQRQSFDVLQTASLTPGVDFNRLEIVLVITNFKPIDLSPILQPAPTPAAAAP